MEVRLTHTSWNEIECDLLVIPLFEDEGLDEEFISGLDQGLGGLLSELRETEEWLGKKASVHNCSSPSGGKRPSPGSARRREEGKLGFRGRSENRDSSDRTGQGLQATAGRGRCQKRKR